MDGAWVPKETQGLRKRGEDASTLIHFSFTNCGVRDGLSEYRYCDFVEVKTKTHSKQPEVSPSTYALSGQLSGSSSAHWNDSGISHATPGEKWAIREQKGHPSASGTAMVHFNAAILKSRCSFYDICCILRESYNITLLQVHCSLSIIIVWRVVHCRSEGPGDFDQIVVSRSHKLAEDFFTSQNAKAAEAFN